MSRVKVRTSAYVSSATKADLRHLARQHQVSESSLLARVIAMAVKGGSSSAELETAHEVPQEAGAATPASTYRRRHAVLSLRLAPEELQAVDREAHKRHLTRGRFVYGLLRTHFKHAPYFGDEEIAALHKAATQISKIGSNLNQIARELKASPYRDPEGVANMCKALAGEITALDERVTKMVIFNWQSWTAK